VQPFAFAHWDGIDFAAPWLNLGEIILLRQWLVRLKVPHANAWNKWRSENPDKWRNPPVPSVAGADLRGANLSHADLHKTALQYTDLRGVNLSRANLRGALLYQADLTCRSIEGALRFTRWRPKEEGQCRKLSQT
jgi:Pentapeptide repeats (8 copies)